MTDAIFLELLASYELAVQAAQRSLTIVVLDAYLMSVERDDLMLNALREDVARFKGLFRTH